MKYKYRDTFNHFSLQTENPDLIKRIVDFVLTFSETELEEVLMEQKIEVHWGVTSEEERENE